MKKIILIAFLFISIGIFANECNVIYEDVGVEFVLSECDSAHADFISYKFVPFGEFASEKIKEKKVGYKLNKLSGVEVIRCDNSIYNTHTKVIDKHKGSIQIRADAI